MSKTIGIYTLGCKVNQYESEAMKEALEKQGFLVLSADKECDAYIINTCTVTAESDRKARQFIRRAISHNPSAVILVTGCLAQVNSESIEKIDGVDYICGNCDKMSVVKKAIELLEKGKNEKCEIALSEPQAKGFEPMAITTFERTRAYVKIEDGCENHCAYCIIPSARGSVRSKPIEDVIAEAKTLVKNGCKEIVFTGIETASYGKDFGKKSTDYLAELLEALDKIDGLERIRLGSMELSIFKKDFVMRLAKLKHLTPHFHLSLQSGCDTVLAKMKRKYNTKMALENMTLLREYIPDMQFTTDVIVGFPQESEEEFEKTLEFCKQARFLRIHVFPYSRRKGTVADKMEGQIEECVKHKRVGILSQLEEEIRKEIFEEQVGKVYSVLFETPTTDAYFGHTASFLDVCVATNKDLHNEIHKVKIVRSKGDFLWGELLD